MPTVRANHPESPMKHGCSPLLRLVRLGALAAALGAAPVLADDYSDVTQLLRAGKLAEAQSRVDRHLAAKPRDPRMRFLRGVIQRDMGRTADAIKTFTQLTEDYPELPEPYNNLAVIHAGQGQYDKARSALEMAIRTNPSYATAHENLGDIYARLASQAYSKALQLEGDNSTAQPKLALIRELFSAPGTNRPAAPAQPVAAAKPPASTAPAAAAPVVSAPPAPAQPATAADSASREVEAAVRAWAQAWASKDMTRYLAAYSQDFETPGKQPRSVWEEERRDRIVGKSSISVTLLDLEVTVQGDRAVAKFRQDYKADRLDLLSLKTLELARTGDRWLIIREISGS